MAKEIYFTEEQTKSLLSQLKAGYRIIKNAEFTVDDDSRYANLAMDETEDEYVCYCKAHKGVAINKKFCPACGNGLLKNLHFILYNSVLAKSKEVISEYQLEHIGRSVSSYVINRTNTPNKLELFSGFYVTKNNDVECGITIYKLKITVSVNKKEVVNLNSKVEYIVNITPGEESKAYKIVRGEKKEVDMFTAFNLSSNTKRYDMDVVWENSSGVIDFLINFPDFNKRTAALDILNISNIQMHKNSFIFLYFYIYSEYPTIELLAKIGYTNLINTTLNKIANSCNKSEMLQKANEIVKVFNPHATSSKLSLNMPKYIADYLNECDATYTEFERWSDICSLEEISRENFEKIISSDAYYTIRHSSSKYYYNDDLGKCVNLLKYGYTLQKLITYINKIAQKENLHVGAALNYLDDYRNMSELMEIEPEPYPSQLKAAHDTVMDGYVAKKNMLTDKKLGTIALQVEDVIFDSDKYTVVMPNCVNDFIKEGQRQHNCVASYVNPVFEGKCIVFFIRKKEDPSMNYVTAEYRNGILYQIKEKNNYSVKDPEVIKYATEICEKIKKSFK